MCSHGVKYPLQFLAIGDGGSGVKIPNSASASSSAQRQGRAKEEKKTFWARGKQEPGEKIQFEPELSLHS
jgi:hypothetical protein